MFLINCVIILLAILYTLLVIPWRTSDPPKDERNICTLGHIVDTLKTLFVKRNEGRRMIFILCLGAMGVYTMKRGNDKNIFFLLSVTMNLKYQYLK